MFRDLAEVNNSWWGFRVGLVRLAYGLWDDTEAFLCSENWQLLDWSPQDWQPGSEMQGGQHVSPQD